MQLFQPPFENVSMLHFEPKPHFWQWPLPPIWLVLLLLSRQPNQLRFLISLRASYLYLAACSAAISAYILDLLKAYSLTTLSAAIYASAWERRTRSSIEACSAAISASSLFFLSAASLFDSSYSIWALILACLSASSRAALSLWI